MNRTTWLQERRMQRFRDVLSRWEKRELSALDASQILGCSERQFRRWRRRFAPPCWRRASRPPRQRNHPASEDPWLNRWPRRARPYRAPIAIEAAKKAMAAAEAVKPDRSFRPSAKRECRNP